MLCIYRNLVFHFSVFYTFRLGVLLTLKYRLLSNYFSYVLQGSTSRIDYSVLQSGPVSPKQDK